MLPSNALTERLGLAYPIIQAPMAAATTPALAAVVNAVVDALSDLGVEHVEMPTTPETVWRAIQRART